MSVGNTGHGRGRLRGVASSVPTRYGLDSNHRLSAMTRANGLRARAYAVVLTVFSWLPGPVRRVLVRAGTPSFTVGAVCVIDHRGTYLMLRQPHRPGWSLPGGLCNRGESAEQAVTREVREETGLRIEVGLPVTVQVNGRVRRVDVVYRIRVDDRPDVVAGGEASEARWLPPERALNGADDPTREVFDRLQRADVDGATCGRILGPA
jgi:ADP-ribose pyrophosphatase YjhB (NUDIX family)